MNTSFFSGLKNRISDKLAERQMKLPQEKSSILPSKPAMPTSPVEENVPQNGTSQEKVSPYGYTARTITAEDIIRRHKGAKENSTKKYHFFRRARQEYWTDQLAKVEGEMPRELRKYWESYSIEEQGEHRLASKEARGWFVVTCMVISLAFYRLSEFENFWLYLSFPFMLTTYCFVISLVFKGAKALWIFLFHRKKVPSPESNSFFEKGIFAVITEHIAIGVFKIPKEDIEKFIAYSKEDRKFKEIFETTLNKEASSEIRSFLMNFIFITVFFWLSQRISIALNNNVSRVGLIIEPVKMVIRSIQQLFV